MYQISVQVRKCHSEVQSRFKAENVNCRNYNDMPHLISVFAGASEILHEIVRVFGNKAQTNSFLLDWLTCDMINKRAFNKRAVKAEK